MGFFKNIGSQVRGIGKNVTNSFKGIGKNLTNAIEKAPGAISSVNNAIDKGINEANKVLKVASDLPVIGPLVQTGVNMLRSNPMVNSALGGIKTIQGYGNQAEKAAVGLNNAIKSY